MNNDSGNRGDQVSVAVKRSTRKRKASQKLKEKYEIDEIHSNHRARKPIQKANRLDSDSEDSSCDESSIRNTVRMDKLSGQSVEKQPLRPGEEQLKVGKRRKVVENSEQDEQCERDVTPNEEESSQYITLNSLKLKLEEITNERDTLVKYSRALEKLNEKYEEELHILKHKLSIGMKISDSKRRTTQLTSSENCSSSVLYTLLMFLSPGRNKVRVSDLNEFIETISKNGIPSVVSECFADMYCGMNNIALLIGLEVNFRFFRRRNIVYSSQLEVEESDGDVVVDWNTCGVTVEGDDIDEESEMGYQQISFERIENVTGALYIIPKCPLHRVRCTEFYASGHETIVRALSLHGYLHLMESKGQSSRVTKSEFQDAVNKCPELIHRLRQCAAYNLGNRKKKCQETFFRMLGYGDIENGSASVPQCTCDTNDQNTNLSQGQNTGTEPSGNCNSRICSKVLSRRLCRFDDRGEIQTNWWRTALHTDICDIQSDSRIMNSSESVVDEHDTLFNNTAAREAFKQFYGMEKEVPKEASIVYIARLDAWMTSVLERCVRLKFGKQKGGTAVRSLKHRYNAIKSVALINLQREMFRNLLNCVRSDSEKYEALLSEAGIPNGNEEVTYKTNEQRKFTIRLRVPWFAGYYYCFKPSVFKKYICSWLGDVKDAYFGFTPSRCERIKIFHQDNAYHNNDSSDEEN